MLARLAAPFWGTGGPQASFAVTNKWYMDVVTPKTLRRQSTAPEATVVLKKE